MLLGVHVSSAGRIYNALERAKELGCNTLQIFSRNPQQWRQKQLEKGDIEEFIRLRSDYGIEKVFIHISYLINLASPNTRLYKSSIKAYIEDVHESAALGADYIVTHMGSHKDTGEFAGLRRFAEAMNKIIKATAGTGVGILLENTSGSGSWLGYKFSHHKKIIAKLKDSSRVGICLDTAHAYLAGYDISSAQGLESLLKEIDESVGIARLKLVHLNDACGELNSRHDRHEDIGKGKIGLEGFRRIVNHPRLKSIPFILETPKKTDKDDPRNLAIVRKLRKGD